MNERKVYNVILGEMMVPTLHMTLLPKSYDKGCCSTPTHPPGGGAVVILNTSSKDSQQQRRKSQLTQAGSERYFLWE